MTTDSDWPASEPAVAPLNPIVVVEEPPLAAIAKSALVSITPGALLFCTAPRSSVAVPLLVTVSVVAVDWPTRTLPTLSVPVAPL